MRPDRKARDRSVLNRRPKQTARKIVVSVAQLYQQSPPVVSKRRMKPSYENVRWNCMKLKDINMRLTRKCLKKLSETERDKYKRLKYRYIKPSLRNHSQWQ